MTEVSTSPVSPHQAAILDAVRRYWGFDSLRPLQAEAIEAGIAHHDSLVVLPTGGGKSLCYQVPPLVADRMDVVVSPLIALMKDQVDGLNQCGYPAAAVHSHLQGAERNTVRQGMREGRYSLLFVTPERLLTERFLAFLEKRGVRSFAIDEAHCVSQWGHDFRPEYRQLATLKQRFPGASVHAYTATATRRVQEEIIEQLGLHEPRRIIGRFDRPNLAYRIQQPDNPLAAAREIVQRHANEAIIIYCLSRQDTEDMAAYLQANGVNAQHYHAGMEKPERSRIQDAFANESLNVVAATVAFGMGIDRSNVRCVIHATMPKSIEHYQQETGRAGRDGLEAECVTLYSDYNYERWQGLIERSAENAEDPAAVAEAQIALLDQMKQFCKLPECRHKALARYFGQDYEADNCGACDVCLDEVVALEDGTSVAQMVLSCVYRLRRPFGAGYLGQVLRGANAKEVCKRGHDQLSTFGLLKHMPEPAVHHIVHQLVDQGLLGREPGDYPTLHLTDASWLVLRGQQDVPLVDPRRPGGPVARSTRASWTDAECELFEHLREWRRSLAAEREVPPYVVLGDATLRLLTKQRPATRQTLGEVRGIGRKKLDEFGDPLLDVIRSFCESNGLAMDVTPVEGAEAGDGNPKPDRQPNARKEQAITMFTAGQTVEAVAEATERAMSTCWEYLVDYIEREQPERIDAWVTDADYQRVVQAMCKHPTDRLKPLYDQLDGEVSYGILKVVLTHHRVVETADTENTDE